MKSFEYVAQLQAIARSIVASRLDYCNAQFVLSQSRIALSVLRRSSSKTASRPQDGVACQQDCQYNLTQYFHYMQ